MEKKQNSEFSVILKEDIEKRGTFTDKGIDIKGIDTTITLPYSNVQKEEVKVEHKTFTEEELQEAKLVCKVMYEEISNTLKEYLKLEDYQYKLIAIWIIGTYFHSQFNTFPYLFLNAMRGSGKTRLLKLISSLGAGGDGTIQNNITEAVLFRIKNGTTTCIDECEQIRSKEKQTLREILNSAYKKGMKISRMRKKKTLDGEQQVKEDFEPFFPIAMANITGVEEVLADRSIVLVIEKSDDPKLTKKQEDFQDNLKIKWIKTSLSFLGSDVALGSLKKYTEKWNKWLDFTYKATNTTNSTYSIYSTNTTKSPKLKAYFDAVYGRDEVVDSETHEFYKKLDAAGIVGRNFELFLPLLLTSKFIDDMLFEDIYEVVKKIVGMKKEEEYHDSVDVSLYQYALSKSDITGFIKIKDITREFRSYVGEEDNTEDKWLNEKWLSRALKRLNLIELKRKVQGCSEVKLNYAKAKEKLKLFTF